MIDNRSPFSRQRGRAVEESAKDEEVVQNGVEIGKEMGAEIL